jgi:hypothetical protein
MEADHRDVGLLRLGSSDKALKNVTEGFYGWPISRRGESVC